MRPSTIASHWRRAAVLLGLYPAWLAMLGLHQPGHVLHARLSGGTVREVLIPWFGFSFTEVRPNPAPLFVVVGGRGS